MGNRIGADSTGSNVAELQSLGATFISRYTSEQSWALTLPEAQRLSAGNIDIVSNYEHYVTDYQGGYNQGVTNAKTAWRVHKACGGPDGRPIYFSVDSDIDPNDSALHEYFRGCGAGLAGGAAQVGVYGSTAVCNALKAAGLVHWTWRSMSTGWRGGAGSPSDYNFMQTGYFNGSYDRDEAVTADFGQWRVGQGGTPLPVPTPSTGGSDMTVEEFWNFKGDNGDGLPGDQPDVHQSLLTARDNTSALVVAVKTLTAKVAEVKAELDAVKAKLGA